MKYFVVAVTPKESLTNVGDEVQSLASSAFLPRVDGAFNINGLFYPHKEDPLKEKTFSIYHGFVKFLYPNLTMPDPNLIPFMTSVHLSIYSKDHLERNLHLLDYFKQHQPIGCRDFATRDFFQKHGVEAYFSGCLTMTLDRSRFTKPNQKREGIIFADAPGSREIESLWGKKITYTAHDFDYQSYYRKQNWIKKIYKTKNNFAGRMKKAEELLSLYAKAELVVTARLHVAMPCLAFGTPVLFTHNTTEGYDHPFLKPLSDSRFGGLIEHTTHVGHDHFMKNLEKGEWEINGTRTAWHEIKNPNTHLPIADKLQTSVRAAVKNASAN